MEKVKVGVVGLGWVAQVVHLPILLKLQEAEVVAVCDRDKGRAVQIADKYGIKKMFVDVRAMLEQVDLEAVIVCTSTDAHREAAIAAMEAGKDVLVEKPIARTYPEALDIMEAARRTRRKLMVGMNHRFRPDTMIIKGFMTEKELGKVFYAKGGWLRKPSSESAWATQKERSGGGVLMDLGIVMLDMACWMLGYPAVKRVSATNFSHKARRVEDSSILTLRMSGGIVVNLEVSWSTVVPDDVYYFHVYGTEGTLSLNPVRILKEMNGSVVNLAPAKIEPPQNLYRRSYENELKHFLGAVRDVHPVISTAEEAVQRMRIIDAVYRSARTGKEIAVS